MIGTVKYLWIILFVIGCVFAQEEPDGGSCCNKNRLSIEASIYDFSNTELSVEFGPLSYWDESISQYHIFTNLTIPLNISDTSPLYLRTGIGYGWFSDTHDTYSDGVVQLGLGIGGDPLSGFFEVSYLTDLGQNELELNQLITMLGFSYPFGSFTIRPKIGFVLTDF